MRDIEGIEKVLAVLEPYWADIHAEFDAHTRRLLQLAGANHDLIFGGGGAGRALAGRSRGHRRSCENFFLFPFSTLAGFVTP
jgi:hypothetical protein